MKIQELKTAKWSAIKGQNIAGATREWHLKEVEIEDDTFSTAVVVQRRGDMETRRVILEPTHKSRAKYQGF